jgi:hypothetical protein
MTEMQTTPVNDTYHSEHLLYRAAMLAIRSILALQSAPELGPGGRVAFDELMAKTPAASRARGARHCRRFPPTPSRSPSHMPHG